jgi:hypothetical protein
MLSFKVVVGDEHDVVDDVGDDDGDCDVIKYSII